jgi:hypothetical protein
MKKIGIIGVLLAILGTAIGGYLYNKPHSDMANAKAAYTTTATDLFAEFEADETTSNNKYLGKIIEVTGTVQEVKNENGKTSVTLEGGGMMFGILCQLDDFSQPKRTDFNTGETITLKGQCTGMLMDVVLVRCVES